MDANAINHLADSIGKMAGALVALVGFGVTLYNAFVTSTNSKRLDRHAEKIDTLMLNTPPPGQPQAVAVAVEGKDKAD